MLRRASFVQLSVIPFRITPSPLASTPSCLQICRSPRLSQCQHRCNLCRRVRRHDVAVEMAVSKQRVIAPAADLGVTPPDRRGNPSGVTERPSMARSHASSSLIGCRHRSTKETARCASLSVSLQSFASWSHLRPLPWCPPRLVSSPSPLRPVLPTGSSIILGLAPPGRR